MPRRLVLLMLAVALPLASQELPFTHFTPGGQAVTLSSASVQKIIQDRQGYIWLAFYSTGISRYDGHSMESYGVADGLADLTVRELVEDARGHLWVGSEAGLVVSDRPLSSYRPGERVRFTSKGLPTTRIRRNCVAAAKDGWVWVATQSAIVRYRAAGRIESGPIANAGAGALFVRRDGTVLAAQGTAINEFSGNGFREIAHTASPTVAFAEGNDGRLWGGSLDGSVWRLEGSSAAIVNRDLSERIVAILPTRSGELWAASLGTGALRLDPRNPAERLVVNRTSGLLGDTLWTLLEDREGNIWFGQNSGASRLRKGYRAFLAYTARSSPPLPDPSAFAVLPKPGELWIGTGGGLVAIKGREARTWRASDGLLSNQVYALGEDGEGRMWIATSAGLNSLEDGKLTSYPSEATYTVRRFGELMCFAGSWGAGCTAAGQWMIFKTASGLPAAGANSLALDDRGHLWVGTIDSGLYRSTQALNRTSNTFVPVWTTANGAPTNNVRSLLFHRGRMWVGTGAGLAVLALPPVIQSGVERPGGPGGAIPPTRSLDFARDDRVIQNQPVIGMAVATDGRGVWVSDNRGLVAVNDTTLELGMRVTKSDGLVDDEAWANGPVATGPNGLVYLATPSGLSIFNPAARETNRVPPIVRMRGVEIGEDNDVDFEYAALTFTDEARVRYQTRLAGFDRGWSSETTDVKIRYTNLPAYFFDRRY